MIITFDPDKDKSNLASHGLSLSFASQLAWDDALVWVDDRFAYDELGSILPRPNYHPTDVPVCSTVH
jgi:uncharacterized DUF497 family protein